MLLEIGKATDVNLTITAALNDGQVSLVFTVDGVSQTEAKTNGHPFPIKKVGVVVTNETGKTYEAILTTDTTLKHPESKTLNVSAIVKGTHRCYWGVNDDGHLPTEAEITIDVANSKIASTRSKFEQSIPTTALQYMWIAVAADTSANYSHWHMKEDPNNGGAINAGTKPYIKAKQHVSITPKGGTALNYNVYVQGVLSENHNTIVLT